MRQGAHFVLCSGWFPLYTRLTPHGEQPLFLLFGRDAAGFLDRIPGLPPLAHPSRLSDSVGQTQSLFFALSLAPPGGRRPTTFAETAISLLRKRGAETIFV